MIYWNTWMQIHGIDILIYLLHYITMCIETITNYILYILCIRKMDNGIRSVSINTPSSNCEFLGIYDKVLSDLEDIDINE